MPAPVVNRPTDVRQKEKDINQKLHLFGIYQAFKYGKLPSNKQCDVALNSALNSKALTHPSQELSEEGQILVEDLRRVIEQAKRLILSKNDGQLLQEFIWGAEHVGVEDVQNIEVGITKDSAQQDAMQAREGLKTLGTLLITNGEFRKLLSDAMIVVRDIASDVSQKAADRLRPSEDQLAQIDQPAEENVWHETSDVSKYKDQVKSRFKKEKAQKEAADVVDTAAQAATGSRQAVQIADIDAHAGVTAATQQAKEKIPEEQKDRTREMAGKAKNYLSQKIPQDRREQTVWRLKKVVIEIQGHRDYQQAIETLLSMAEKYGSQTRNISQQGAGNVQGVRGQENVQNMEKNLRVLIERFAHSTSLDDLFDSLENIYRDADKDPELKGWFKNVNTFIRKTLQEQGYVMQDTWSHQYDQLAEHGRYLLRGRYKNNTDRILDELKFIGDQFNQDPQNKAFGDSMQQLFNDLGRDSNGKVAFKKHLLKDIRDVILPAVFENIRYVPVPRIEVSDPMADVVIENLVIESDNLMPNVVEFGSDNYFRWGRKKISNKRDNKIMISVSGIQADLRDVSYYIDKKQGFPSITDTGVMDIFLGGTGFGFKIAASTAHKEDRQHFVRLDKVAVKIDTISVKLKKSKHKVLFTIFKPLLFRVVRPVLEKVLEKQVRDAFMKGDAFAYEVHSEVKRAQETVHEKPEDAPNVYNRYMDAFRTRWEYKKRRAAEVAPRETKVQTTTTLKDSLFPDIELPGGITTKATEYDEIAKKGERWESPIFTIGTAPESTDIPKPADISRKPHTTAAGQLADQPAAGTGTHVTNGGAAGVTNGHTKTLTTNGRTHVETNGKLTQNISMIAGTDTAFNPQAA
ncbi:hypothetical protein ARAM_004195 [Aspergillus rambellii]|uniref:Bactericidal permeability-increasing protein n=1 Tax=Aspergillus rambellii TaxID=308745 RepID=A0A0F8V6L5_9EURO|nr:hypothetical protein ARAM_004195 [Aspergillus rambellii]